MSSSEAQSSSQTGKKHSRKEYPQLFEQRSYKLMRIYKHTYTGAVEDKNDKIEIRREMNVSWMAVKTEVCARAVPSSPSHPGERVVHVWSVWVITFKTYISVRIRVIRLLRGQSCGMWLLNSFFVSPRVSPMSSGCFYSQTTFRS